MELKAKTVQSNKSSTNNQNVNSMNINPGDETAKSDLATFANNTQNLPENSVQFEDQTFKLEFDESVANMSSSAESPCLNQTNHTLINNDLSFNSNNFNSQLTNDLENNPHLINRSQDCNMNTLTSNLTNNLPTNLTTNNLTTLTNQNSSNDAIKITNLRNNQVNFTCSPQSDYFPSNQSEIKQTHFETFAQSTNQSNTTCATCSQQIKDRFLLKVNGHTYHEGKCLLCCCCGSILNDVCYHKNSKLYCKLDYLRLFYRKCHACNDFLFPKELVRKVYKDYEAIFHEKCFVCSSCNARLETGDQFRFNGGLLFCKQHSQAEQIELCSKVDHLVPTSPTINSPLTNLCQQSINQMPPLVPINNPLNSNQSLHQRTTLCNLSNSLQNNLPPNSLLAADLQANSNLNNLMICSSSNNLSLSSINQSPNQLNGKLNKQVNKEPLGRTRTDGRKGPKRPRTILTTAQRRVFKSSFEISQKPCRKVREQLAQETGLTVRVVQVWFQNQRASKKKERRRLESKLMHQSPSNMNNGIGSQTDPMKNMQHHNALTMNSHLQSSTSFSNEESRSQMSYDDEDDDFEHIQFVNSPNDDGSYYSQASYSKSINEDLEDENMSEDENCLDSLMANKKLTCNKKNVNCNNSSNNSNSFEYTNSSNAFPIQTSAAFSSNSENSTPPICAVAQAISSSNDILTTNCSTNLSKSNSSTLNSSTGSSNANGLEFTQTSNVSMTPIDKLYSMQSSYFSIATENCENCLTIN